ncbi:MAG: hypothetical protein J6S60_04025 [Oscillospiraceae bacterium]|nr:hypothetical protein [Oscillospiraceae bacterium]
MAFVMRKPVKIVDELVFLDEDDGEIGRVPVQLDVTSNAGRLTRALNAVILAERHLPDGGEDAQAEYDRAFVALCKEVFGPAYDKVAEVAETTENLAANVLPFLRERVMPAIAKASRQRAGQLAK